MIYTIDALRNPDNIGEWLYKPRRHFIQRKLQANLKKGKKTKTPNPTMSKTRHEAKVNKNSQRKNLCFLSKHYIQLPVSLHFILEIYKNIKFLLNNTFNLFTYASVSQHCFRSVQINWFSNRYVMTKLSILRTTTRDPIPRWFWVFKSMPAF